MRILTLFLACFCFITQLVAQNWNEHSKVIASDRSANDHFGGAVAIDGDIAVIGAPYKNESVSVSEAGEVYVFERINGNWIEVQTLIPTTRVTEGLFGYSVAISGNYIVVGSYFDGLDKWDSNYVHQAGAAMIYERDAGGTWNLMQKICASDRDYADEFGWSVSISGNSLVVGARADADSILGGSSVFRAGSAYLFQKDAGGTWVETQKIVAPDREVSDNFGYAVSISGNKLAVSAPYDDKDAQGANLMLNAGSLYLYQEDGNGTWTMMQKILATDRASGSVLGESISLSNGYLIAGSVGQDAAYIFETNAVGLWVEAQKITSSDNEYDDNFAQSVSVDADYVVVGANFEDEDASGGNSLNAAGAAYIFERDASGIWSEICKVVNADREYQDNFGFAVAISGNYALIGADLEDDDLSGANDLTKAGSAYFFGSPNIGVSESKHLSRVIAFPNPTSSRLTLDFGDTYQGSTYTVVNLLGEILETGSVNCQKQDISLTGPDGVYLIKIQNLSGFLTIFKVVKRN